MNPAAAPIEPHEAAAAFQILNRFDRIVLAVSGGPDSLALLALIADWRRDVSVDVVTVDHQLRPQSAAEALAVREIAQGLGLQHTILIWEGAKPTSGKAAAARAARYRLLEQHALETGAGAIVVAHHLDDQAETLIMRLKRGAGVEGLAAMLPERPISDGSQVSLVRPLLQFSKERLIATVAARGLTPVDDPSNRDMTAERVRIRNEMPALQTLGLTANVLGLSARRLGEARQALDYATRAFAADISLHFEGGVFAGFDSARFAAGPVALRQRVLMRLISLFGGDSPEPELSEIEELTGRLERDRQSSVTLGGAMISAGTQTLRVWRELGRLDMQPVLIEAGQEIVWDSRFLLRVDAAAAPAEARPLGLDGASQLLKALNSRSHLPARAVATVPAFFAGAQLLAVPSLTPYAGPGAPDLGSIGYDVRPIAEGF